MRAGKKWPARALHAPTDFGMWLDTGGHAVLQYSFSSGMTAARSAKSRGGGDDGGGGGEGGGGEGGSGEGGGGEAGPSASLEAAAPLWWDIPVGVPVGAPAPKDPGPPDSSTAGRRRRKPRKVAGAQAAAPAVQAHYLY